MKITPDHVSLVFPTILQTHAASNTALAVKKDVRDLELFLKSAALMSRGIVVSDSDLNNNKAFYSLLRTSDVVQEAFRSGFIRRAVRQENQEPVDQASVAQSLRRSSPNRFAEIPEGYVEFLDGMFSRLEAQYPPFEWAPAELGSLFSLRLQQMLLRELHSPVLPEKRAIVNRMLDWVRDRNLQDEPVLAARLESDLRPANPSHAEADAWAEAWQIVLDAYNGNIPLAFEGSLIQADNGIHTDRYIPAGPETSGAQRKAQIQLYELVTTGRAEQFSVTKGEEPSAPSGKDFVFDVERLSELSFARVLQLRDACDPGELLEIRYHSLGSPEHLGHYLPRLTEAALVYAERLHVQGRVLTKTMLQDQIRATLSTPNFIRIYAGIYEPDEVEQELAALASSLPVEGSEIVLCDLSLLKEKLPGLRLSDEDDPISWVFKRPDFRIIREMVERGAADAGR